MIAPPAPAPVPPGIDAARPLSGADLRAARIANGETLEGAAAATRIRRGSLELIEADLWEQLPGPVYARGYARTYAAHLGLDPGDLRFSGEPPARPVPAAARLSLVRHAPRLPARVVLTRPVLGLAAVLAGAAAFTAYAWYEIDSARRDFSPPVAAAAPVPPIASLPPAPAVSPAAAEPVPAASAGAPAPAAGRRVTVVLRSTAEVWIDVVVDGQRPDGPQGRFLEPGSAASYVGHRVSVTSGNGANTLVTFNGQEAGALGSGVLTRDFSGQT